MKLAIGTVQFGLSYGINNITGIPEESEITKIFQLASTSGIQVLDTASAYGNSEEKIGRIAGTDFKIVTKFSNVSNAAQMKNQFHNSLQKLGSSHVYAYLAHNADNLLDHPALWDSLLELKQKKQVQKIGYSLYTPEQLNRLLTIGLVPDLVQIPYSLLDRKFEDSLTVLKKWDVEIHARSVFLQGLYLMNPEKLPAKLEPLKKDLQQLQDCCKKFNVSVVALALNYISENPAIDNVVIGVDSLQQLKENIEKIHNWKPDIQLIEQISQIEVQHKELLNPANW